MSFDRFVSNGGFPLDGPHGLQADSVLIFILAHGYVQPVKRTAVVDANSKHNKFHASGQPMHDEHDCWNYSLPQAATSTGSKTAAYHQRHGNPDADMTLGHSKNEFVTLINQSNQYSNLLYILAGLLDMQTRVSLRPCGRI